MQDLFSRNASVGIQHSESSNAAASIPNSSTISLETIHKPSNGVSEVGVAEVKFFYGELFRGSFQDLNDMGHLQWAVNLNELRMRKGLSRVRVRVTFFFMKEQTLTVIPVIRNTQL